MPCRTWIRMCALTCWAVPAGLYDVVSVAFAPCGEFAVLLGWPSDPGGRHQVLVGLDLAGGRPARRRELKPEGKLRQDCACFRERAGWLGGRVAAGRPAAAPAAWTARQVLRSSGANAAVLRACVGCSDASPVPTVRVVQVWLSCAVSFPLVTAGPTSPLRAAAWSPPVPMAAASTCRCPNCCQRSCVPHRPAARSAARRRP